LIEHLHNPGQFLEGSARALKPGGRLVLSTPNVFSVMLNLMYWKNYDHAFNPEHALWLCPQTLRELLRRCGFRITKLEFVDDLEPALVASRVYRAFTYGWSGVRLLLPKRYRNTMVAVCELV
jgi:SAM-dependent methyltransferase